MAFDFPASLLSGQDLYHRSANRRMNLRVGWITPEMRKQGLQHLG